LKPVLGVASERREFAGVLKRARGVRRLEAPVDFACRCEFGGRSWILVANGPGPGLAARAVEAGGGFAEPGAVVSLGYCGGLDPALALYSILAGSRVVAGGHSRECSMPVTQRAFVSGTIVSLDRVVTTPEEKLCLREDGGDGVEMEAAAVGAWAAQRGVPFSCVKIVTDRADEGFAVDMNKMRDPAGRFSRSRLTARAMRSPVCVMPELIRLAQRSREAAELLGDFLADCRF
jgi:adenosylhomocysteine nucleosidase